MDCTEPGFVDDSNSNASPRAKSNAGAAPPAWSNDAGQELANDTLLCQRAKIESPDPFAFFCSHEPELSIHVSAASAVLYLDTKLLQHINGSAHIRLPTKSLVPGVHSLEVISQTASGEVCIPTVGVSQSHLIYFHFKECNRYSPHDNDALSTLRGEAAKTVPTHNRRLSKSVSSWMQCAGTDGLDFKSKSQVNFNGVCWMKNVCYNPTSANFIFYTAPEHEPGMWQFDSSEAYDNHDLPLLTLKPSPMNLGLVPFMVQHELLPMATAGEEVEYMDAQDALLYHPLAPHAWGLFISENLWAVYMMQATFGRVSSLTQILLNEDCAGTYATIPGRAGEVYRAHRDMHVDRCLRLQNALHMTVATKPPLHVRNDEPFTNGRRVCFDNLYVGSGAFKFRDEPISAAMPRRAFRDWMWSNLGRPPKPCLLKQQILVNVKLGRRKWLNFVELLAALHAEFSEQSAMYLNDPTVLSFTQEVALLQSTTVLIAHNGAISANLIFLPDGSTAIVSDVWSGIFGSTRMEQDGHLYSGLGHIRVMYYMVKGHETPNPLYHHPQNSSTAVNITRMAKLVRFGLQESLQHLTPDSPKLHEGCGKQLGWHVPDGADLHAQLQDATYDSTDVMQVGAQPQFMGSYFTKKHSNNSTTHGQPVEEQAIEVRVIIAFLFEKARAVKQGEPFRLNTGELVNRLHAVGKALTEAEVKNMADKYWAMIRDTLEPM